ncbi:hypothetical protein YDYSY3_10760 [Paenibacillus chitinolyticus]|uniref:hypothetical protein n=1 Tax=Paenibacillus chitinolyticus TaxID=79263 RepID=UPI0026E4F81D|nr:hypothetical protein [Paenibacillus chitinolyticus]GKS10076.1 hypothetical protein YDYSY3_10760 [Paenibacillus chitinolyticus]
MAGDQISNSCSFVLNYLQFVDNIYNNFYNGSAKFPAINLNKEGLLEHEVFIHNKKEMWNRYLEDLSNSMILNPSSEAITILDLRYITNPSLFNHLFKDKSNSESAWNLFQSWYWSQTFGCQYVNENVSHELILNISETLAGHTAVPNFLITSIYDDFPDGLESAKDNIFVFSITELSLPNGLHNITEKILNHFRS